MTILDELQIYKEANNWKMGLEALGKYPKPLSEELLNEYGWFLSRDKQYDKAIEIYNELIKLNPSRAKYYYMLGYQYYDQLMFYQSVCWFEKALNISPDYFIVKYRLSYAYSKLQKKASFKDEYFSKCIKLLENAHSQFKSFDEQSVDKYKSDYSNICFLHGKQISLFSDYREKTVSLFKTAVEYDPLDINKHYQLAKAYYNIRHYQEAEDALLLADKPYIKALHCEILSALGKFEELDRAIYPQIASSKYATEEYFISIIRAYIKQKLYSKALLYAKQAASKYIKSYKCLYSLGFCYEKLKLFKSAISSYEKALLLTNEKDQVQKRINEIMKETNNNPYDEENADSAIEQKNTGVINKYFDTRGFGFITDNADGNSYFFHISNVEKGYFPAVNDKVEFELENGPNGLTATLIKKAKIN